MLKGNRRMLKLSKLRKARFVTASVVFPVSKQTDYVLHKILPIPKDSNLIIFLTTHFTKTSKNNNSNCKFYLPQKERWVTIELRVWWRSSLESLHFLKLKHKVTKHTLCFGLRFSLFLSLSLEKPMDDFIAS